MAAIKVLAFDADDTLWLNESFYHETELALYRLLQGKVEGDRLSQLLFNIENSNFPVYGYGAKSFTLSMIETAIKATGNRIEAEKITEIIRLGKKLTSRPIVLIKGVQDVLQTLNTEYDQQLVLVTKGDLIDQRRKLKESSLAKFFDHIEIMSKKSAEEYSSLINFLEIRPDEFMMTGNSLRSDVFPVLQLGAHANYIPFNYEWEEELSDSLPKNEARFHQLRDMGELPNLLDKL